MDETFFMREALAEARAAMRGGEIPVGAVVVRGGGATRAPRAARRSPTPK